MKGDEVIVKQESILARRLKKLISQRKKNRQLFYKVAKKDSLLSILYTSNDENTRSNTLVLQVFRFILKINLPKFIKPHRVSLYTSNKGMAKRSWSYHYAPITYGISYLPKEKVYHIFYGVNSHNRRGFPKDKVLLWTPPWTKYNLSRHRIIDKNNSTFWENMSIKDTKGSRSDVIDVMGLCPKIRFECLTEQNSRVIGSCFIEEKQWRKGFSVKGIPLMSTKVLTRRVLKICLHYLNIDGISKPTHTQCEFRMLPNESLKAAIERFCKIRSIDKDPNRRLKLEHIIEE